MSEESVNKKRITANFKDVRVFDQDSLQEFNKWKNDMIAKGAKVIFDRRNNIYCIAPTMDYEMYYNYVMYLNAYHNEWVNVGYFDAGMVPYMMWPSFMDASPVMEQMRKLTRTLGIDLISVPSVALLKPTYIANGQDYWIFREDLYNLMKVMEKSSPEYRFDVSRPEDATLSKFLKPLAELSVRARGGSLQ
jgi:hypothetical protein